MYGKLNERKLNENDYIMSCQKVREQLSTYMNDQAKRVNIDSAKKRAVVQRIHNIIQDMDYEGFRQMVLGANIFPTKTKQLCTFTKGQPENIGSTLLRQKETKDKDKDKDRIKKTQQILALERIHTKSEMHCSSFREFKKKFNDNYSKVFDVIKTLYCYNLVKEQNEERLRKIFNAECQGNILIKIVGVFEQVMKEMVQNNTVGIVEEAGFILQFFKIIMSIPTMKPMTLLILSKKQKQTVYNFLIGLSQVLKTQEYDKQIEQIGRYFKK